MRVAGDAAAVTFVSVSRVTQHNIAICIRASCLEKHNPIGFSGGLALHQLIESVGAILLSN